MNACYGVRAPGQKTPMVNRRRVIRIKSRKKRPGKRAGKRRHTGKCERLRRKYLMIAYCNIRGIRGSKVILEKVIGAFDLILLQETKLQDNAQFSLEGWTLDRLLGNSGLAIASRINSSMIVEHLDGQAFNTRDRKIQLVRVSDPRLPSPLTIANLYMACDSAPNAKDWDFLQDLSYNCSPFLIVGDFNSRYTSWDPTGCNRNGLGLFDALADLNLCILNTGEPTRLAERYGDPDTVLDLALIDEDTRDSAVWKGSHQVGSDHFLCEFRFCYQRHNVTSSRKKALYSQKDKTGVWAVVKDMTRKEKHPRTTITCKNADAAWKEKNRKKENLSKAGVLPARRYSPS